MKRAFDLVVSVTMLIVLSPALLVLALLVRQKHGSPVLFAQTRIGKGGQPFKILKFRTMTNQRDHRGDLLPDAERLTRFGLKLRSTSLDELPELWNVIRGDMSLVGPRPLLTQYVARYSARQMRRHEVLPGITGWAQINGRNAVNWDERLEMDVWYVEHQSFWLDLKVLWLTIGKVLKRDGVSAEGHATMPEFMGSAVVSGDPAENPPASGVLK